MYAMFSYFKWNAKKKYELISYTAQKLLVCLKLLHTFAGMEIQMTHSEAWQDFFAWIKTQAEWKDIPRTEKQYFYKTEKSFREGSLGNSRIEAVLGKYAPDRYEFRSVVILRKEK